MSKKGLSMLWTLGFITGLSTGVIVMSLLFPPEIQYLIMTPPVEYII